MTGKIEHDLIAALSFDMTKYVKKIMEYVPKDKEKILKHLASASIHLALFMQDILEDKDGEPSQRPDNVDAFIEKCGCREWMKK